MNYLSTTELAKLVRQELRARWDGKGPGNRDGWAYKVNSDKYAGGSAVRVTVPKDYPRQAERDLYRALSPWGSSGFDGMTDSTYSKGHHLCPEHGVTLTAVGGYWGSAPQTLSACCGAAEPVSLGASYVTVSRDWR